MRNNLIKNLIVILSVIALALPTFALSVSASDVTQIVISGEDLAALILSGTWECYYTIGGTEQQLDYVNCSVINGDCVVKFSNVSFTSGQTWTNSSIYFDTTLNYDNVVAVTALVGGNVGYYYRSGPSSSDMTWTSKKMTYADGYVQGTSTIDFQDASPSDLNGTYQFTDNSLGYSGGFAMLSAAFESMTIRNLMLNGFWDDIDLQVSVGVNLPADCVYVIDSITISLSEDSSSGGDSGDSDSDGSSSETQQAILNQIEKANEKLDLLIEGDDEQKETINENQDRIDNIKDNMAEYNDAVSDVAGEAEENIDVEQSTEDINSVIDNEANESVVNVLSAFWGNTLIQFMTSISSALMLVSFLLYGAH